MSLAYIILDTFCVVVGLYEMVEYEGSASGLSVLRTPGVYSSGPRYLASNKSTLATLAT